MGFFNIFGQSKKKLGKTAIGFTSDFPGIIDTWAQVCNFLLTQMDNVKPARTSPSKTGLIWAYSFQFYITTQLIDEKKYIKKSYREEYFDLIANILIHENNLDPHIFLEFLKRQQSAPDPSGLIFTFSWVAATDFMDKQAVLGEATTLSHATLELISATKMSVAAYFGDKKTFNKMLDLLPTSQPRMTTMRKFRNRN